MAKILKLKHTMANSTMMTEIIIFLFRCSFAPSPSELLVGFCSGSYIIRLYDYRLGYK